MEIVTDILTPQGGKSTTPGSNPPTLTTFDPAELKRNNERYYSLRHTKDENLTDDDREFIKAYEKDKSERDAAGRRWAEDYWAKVRKAEQDELEGNMDWFISNANTTANIAFDKHPIKRNADRVPEYLLTAYQMQVERYGRTVMDAENIMNVARFVATWMTERKFKNGLMFIGGVGCGKTTMMYAMQTVYRVLNGEILKIVDARQLSTMAKDEKSEFKNYCTYPMLGIDDLGTEPLSVKSYGNDISPLVDMLLTRYNGRMFTIITTNLSKDELRKCYGDRVYDRIHEMFGLICYDPKQKSYRQ